MFARRGTWYWVLRANFSFYPRPKLGDIRIRSSLLCYTHLSGDCSFFSCLREYRNYNPAVFMSYKVASLSVACVAWRFWLGALNNKGGWGQRNCKEIGAGTAWTTASPLVRARFARVFPSPLSRAPSLTRVSPSCAVLSCAHYFQVPAMQAIPTWKSYLRRDDVHLHSPSPVFTIWEPGGYSAKGRSRRKFLIKPETNLGVAQPFLTPNHFKTQRVLIIHGKDIIMEYFNLYPYVVLILKETFTAKFNGVLPRTP